MILLPRGLSRLVGFLLLLALAVAGGGVAVGSLTSSGGSSISGLATLIGLDVARDEVGGWLGQIEASGSVALLSALGGGAAVLGGLLLLVGVLWPRRERLVVLDRNDDGVLGARRGALTLIATVLAGRVRGVRVRRARIRPRRRARPGGKLRVRVAATSATDDPANALRETLTPLTDAFGLRHKVKVKRADEGQPQ